MRARAFFLTFRLPGGQALHCSSACYPSLRWRVLLLSTPSRTKGREKLFLTLKGYAYAYFLCLQLLFDVCMLGILWSEYCRRRLQPIFTVKINIIKRVSAGRRAALARVIGNLRIFPGLSTKYSIASFTGLGVLVTNILVNRGPRVITMSPLGTETRWKSNITTRPGVNKVKRKAWY